MNYKLVKDKVIIQVKDFCIKQILECGQCFRYEQLSDKEYIITANNRIIKVKQHDDTLELYCDEKDFLNIWSVYFDMDRDYSKIKEELSSMDSHLKEAINDKYGVRLLKQDPWEMLISFIISQNKNITHIKKLIEDISKTYGSYLTTYNNKDYYAFPTVNQLSCVSEEDFRELKVGFRAPYLIDAINKVARGEVALERISKMSYDEGLNMLTQIKGVGRKVADCVLLFAYGKYEVFPTDVWVKRIIEYFYLEKESKIDEIKIFAKSYFGDLAGFAQQYLFYYARDKKLGRHTNTAKSNKAS